MHLMNALVQCVSLDLFVTFGEIATECFFMSVPLARIRKMEQKRLDIKTEYKIQEDNQQRQKSSAI